MGEAPEGMSLQMEVDILRRTDRILEHACRNVGASGNTDEDASLETLDLALRILTALITKREGVLDRLTAKAPRVQELPEGVDSLADLEPAIPFVKLIARLMKLIKTLKIDSHATPD